MPEDHQGKSVVITGASAGLGAALARAFAGAGAGLTQLARREDRLEQVAADCRGCGVEVAAVWWTPLWLLMATSPA